jgi:hypothetical protein
MLVWLLFAASPVRADASHDPFGAVDAVTVDDATDLITVRGWAADPDGGATQRVHIYVDGHGVRAVSTGRARPDVERRFPAAGPNSGFAVRFPAPPGRGSHTVCIYGINIGPGQTTVLGCARRTVTVAGAVIGHIDKVVWGPQKFITFSGWALDPYDAISPTEIAFVPAGATVDFPFYEGPAGSPRPDVDRRYPNNGRDHGFDLTFDGLALSPGDRMCIARTQNVGEQTFVTPFCATLPPLPPG